jgi:hypothetical protein
MSPVVATSFKLFFSSEVARDSFVTLAVSKSTDSVKIEKLAATK